MELNDILLLVSLNAVKTDNEPPPKTKYNKQFSTNTSVV